MCSEVLVRGMFNNITVLVITSYYVQYWGLYFSILNYNVFSITILNYNGLHKCAIIEQAS